jgi:pimeloyl-ACP methyl ester carboxylesterase
MMRRIVVLAGLAMGLGLVPGAQAQVRTGTCDDRELRGAECGSVGVPLDHDNATPPPQAPSIGLAYVRFPATTARRGTVVFLAGGPGQAATPLAGSIANGSLRSLRRRYDLVFVDQRGTGESGALACSTAPKGTFEIAPDASPSAISAAVSTCAAELGPNRRLYSTYQTARDLESLRTALGVEQIIPLGVSYGGQVAGEYARRYPERTQALILDSTGPIEGGDVLGALPQLALPRVLRETCFPPGCDRILGSPQVLLRGAVERIGADGMSGRVVSPTGRKRTSRISVADLYSLIRMSDTDPALRMAIPAALEAAARGDAAPLLRLAFSGTTGEGEPPEAERVNEVRLLATNCIEGRLPWSTESDPATRPALLEQALAADAERYAPFPVASILPSLDATFCLGWPATPRPPIAASTGPDLPVLILAGRADLRTPLEDQRRAGLQFPRATVVGVPGVGHSVLGTDQSGCASDAVTAFLFGRKRQRCPRADVVPLALPVFRSLSELPGAAGDLPRRIEQTAVAVDLTLRDVARQVVAVGVGGSSAAGDVAGRVLRIGGLRGGRLELRRRTLVLRSYEVVPGVRVSGRLTSNLVGSIVVSGTAEPGSLTVLKTGTLRGTLGGENITYRPLAVANG